MTYEMYHNIFIICSVSAGVTGLVTILLFFLLRIPAVIGELTGVTARKGIEEIRNGNVKNSHQKREPKRKKRRQKEKTDLNASNMIQSQDQQMGTAVLTQDQQMGTAVLAQEQAIEILGWNRQMETALLQNQENDTALLGAEFEVLQDITIVHTEESVSDIGRV